MNHKNDYIIDFSLLGQQKIMAGTLPTWKLTGLFYISCVCGEVRSLDLGYGPKSYGLWAQSIKGTYLRPLFQFITPLLPVFCPSLQAEP